MSDDFVRDVHGLTCLLLLVFGICRCDIASGVREGERTGRGGSDITSTSVCALCGCLLACVRAFDGLRFVVFCAVFRFRAGQEDSQGKRRQRQERGCAHREREDGPSQGDQTFQTEPRRCRFSMISDHMHTYQIMTTNDIRRV